MPLPRRLLATLLLTLAAASSPAQDSLRPAVAAPLQAAQKLIEEKKPREALAKVAEAEAAAPLSPFETLVLQRLRAAAALEAGDTTLAMQSVEAALATGAASPADRLLLIESLVGTAARARDHARVLRWSQAYADAGGNNAGVRAARVQSLVATGDEKGGLDALNALIAAAEQAGRPVPEPQLRLAAQLQQRLKDEAAFARTIERLATQYPRREYWSDLVAISLRRAGANERAQVELFRLLRAAGALASPGLREEYAEVALRLGQPGEAAAVLEEAPPAEGAKLRDSAKKQAADDRAQRASAEAAAKQAADGNGLVQLGFAMVAELAAPGAAAEPGLALIEQGITKGGLKRPVEARLHLAIAQLAAGRKDAAQQTLRALQADAANDPLADAVRLWALWAAAPALLPAR